MGKIINIQNKYLQVHSQSEKAGLSGITQTTSSTTRSKNYITKLNHEIVWASPIFNPSGYASGAISFICGLDKIIDLTIRHNSPLFSNTFIDNIPISWKEVLFRRHKIPPQDWNTPLPLNKNDVFIQHLPAHAFIKVPAVFRNIGRTMFETDRIPADWVQKCNEMDEIWVPSRFNKQTFIQSGVNEDKIVIIPECIDTDIFNPDGIIPFELPNKAGYNFLSIFEWTNRKGWDVLLKAYFESFSSSDDVCLFLRTYLLGSYDRDTKVMIEEKIDALILRNGYKKSRLPRYELITNQLPFNDMLRLYKSADAFVLPSRGEGWGRPHMEAMAFGLPVIGTNWSGNTEFMNTDNSYLIDVEAMVPIKENEIPIYFGHKWAEPSCSHLKQLLRHVYSHQDEAKIKGGIAKKHIADKYNSATVAGIIVERLQQFQDGVTAAKSVSKRIEDINPSGPKIVWEGSQFIKHSLALINREMCLRLAKDNANLSLLPFGVDTYTPAKNEPEAVLQKYIRKNAGEADIHVRLQWPPNLNPPSSGRWVINQPWEFGFLPKEWVKVFSRHVDEMWVISSYVRDVYIQSGIPAARVFVVPCGINPNIFNLSVKPHKLKTKKKFKFLFVGGTIMRKGIDILLDAYTQSYTASDNVCLVIKDMGGDSFYKGMNLREKIAAISRQKNAPAIEYIDTMLSDKQVAGLYKACDVLVHPYRGEGFGLPILEAMACGTPAIVTNGGACLDFCSEKNSMLIDAKKLIYADKRIGEYEMDGYPWLLEPSVDHLKELMVYAFQHQKEMRELGELAHRDAHEHWTWDKAYIVMKERISALSKMPIRRFEPVKPLVKDKGTVSLIKESARKAGIDPLLEMAERFIGEEKIDDAVTLLNEMLAKNPNNIDALNDLGVAAIMTKNYHAAAAHIRKVITLDPTNETAQGNFQHLEQIMCSAKDDGKIQESEVLINAGETAKARVMLNELLISNPVHIDALNDLSVVEIMEKNWQEAAILINKVVTLDPLNESAKQNLQYLDQVVSGIGV
jgi:glycosyltransferase involved in cell wall biosynthesis